METFFLPPMVFIFFLHVRESKFVKRYQLQPNSRTLILEPAPATIAATASPACVATIAT
jgi:hypothetical protein